MIQGGLQGMSITGTIGVGGCVNRAMCNSSRHTELPSGPVRTAYGLRTAMTALLCLIAASSCSSHGFGAIRSAVSRKTVKPDCHGDNQS